jgi:hypothetical protein
MRRLAFVALLMSTSAEAAWPEDVSISSMTSYEGITIVDRDALSTSYTQLIRELGVAVGTRSVLPADTLGIRNFEIVADTTVSFNSPKGTSADPSPWQRAHTDNDPGAVLYAPGFTMRKGLGFSTEIGVSARWLGNTRQAVVHAFVRAAVVEGYKPWPDVNLHLGYSGYIGNDELELGVFEAGITLGSKFAFGSINGPRTAKISPFVDVTMLSITATPRVDDEVVSSIGATTFGKRGGDADLAPVSGALVVGQFSGGFQLIAGQVSFRVSGGWTSGTMPFVASSLGFTY